MKSIIQKDYYRHTGRWIKYPITRVIFNLDFRYTYLIRKISDKKTFLITRLFYKLYLRCLSRQINYYIDPKVSIGEGFYLIHAFGIYIHPEVIIGKNCNFTHAVIIGQTQGRKRGYPVIGDEVWIGAYSVIEGNIKIGNNVLIAPKTYVDFDIPDNSIVIGDPPRIINRKDATLGYINNKIE